MTTKQDAIKLALEELNIAKGHIDYRMLNSAQMAIDDAISALATKADYERAMASTAPAESKTAKQQYDEIMKNDDEPDAIERLRFFLSLALKGQDWLDVEPFLDALCRCAPKAAMSNETVKTINAAFAQYDQDLKDRKHGGVSMDSAWHKIRNAWKAEFARAIRGEKS